jgi:hypothetical protein
MGLMTMNLPAASLIDTPYGLAFAIEDLVAVRVWAEQRGLILTVALDQVLDGVEFEEVLILSAPDHTVRKLTFWHTLGSVMVQAPNCRPRAFATVPDALDALRPEARKRTSWLKFFRLAG